MIIHIGDNISLFEDDILIIMDKDSVELSKDNLDIINYLLENKKLVNKLDKEVKSYIIVSENRSRCRNNREDLKLYISNISSTSLLNRQRI